MSPFTDACKTLPCLAALSSNKHSALLLKQTVDGLFIFPSFDAPLLLSLFSNRWFCSTSYAEMTVVVVEGEMQVAVAGIRQVVPLLFL